MTDTEKLKELYKRLGAKSQNGAVKGIDSIAEDRKELSELRAAIVGNPASLPKVVIRNAAHRHKNIANMYDMLAQKAFGVSGAELTTEDFENIPEMFVELVKRSELLDGMLGGLADLVRSVSGYHPSYGAGLAGAEAQTMMNDVQTTIDEIRRELAPPRCCNGAEKDEQGKDCQTLRSLISDAIGKMNADIRKTNDLEKSQGELIRAVAASAELIGTMRRYMKP